MADETEGELQTPADIDAARAALLADPPSIIDVNAPTSDEIAAQAAAADAATLDELGNEPPPEAPGEPAPAATTPAAPPAPAEDPFAPFGGQQAVQQAWQVQEALRTQDGVRALVANGLNALGYSPQQVSAALAAGEVAPPPDPNDPLAGLEDDEPITAAQVRSLLEREREASTKAALAEQAKAIDPMAKIIEQQQTLTIRNNTDHALIEVLGAVPTEPDRLAEYQETVKRIVERGGRYFDSNQWSDPNHARMVVQQAHAELNAEAETYAKAYLARKKAARDSQPVNTGGGAGGEGPLAEPKTMAEAREQATKTGFFR